MGWSSVLLLLFIVIVSLLGYLILNLNTNVVPVDLLFYDLEIRLGMILLVFFLIGFLVSITLEIIYFFSKKSDKSD
tara:strand:+ start:169 stop:396 length:228 start_codon:yes stop_codon:yes gene_type:complete